MFAMDIFTLGRSLRALPLLFVALTGSLGTVYLLGINMNSSVGSEELNISWNDSNLLDASNEYFTIFGIKEESRALEFVIRNYNEKTTYEIDFGDGSCQETTQSNLSHTYNKAGDYFVRLSIVYLDELLVLEDSKIRISVSQP